MERRPHVRPSEVAAYWDGEADGFDIAPDHGLADPRVREAWLGLLRGLLPPPPAEVADLGAGTGTLAVLLASQGYSVAGLDISPRMVERARAKALAAGLDIAFSLGDAERPRLAAGAFDVVICRHVLWAMNDPAAALRCWMGLLRAGGRLVLLEGRWHTGGGLGADQLGTLVGPLATTVSIQSLPDPALWGGPIEDERYVAVARP